MSGSDMQTNEQIASYSIGHNIGNQVKAEKEVFKVDLPLLLKGLDDAFNEIDSPLSGEQITEAFEHIQKLSEAKKAKEGEAALALNVAYLAENGKKDGVTTTASGLQYEVITKGSGTEKPLATHQVKTHYHGTLTNGTVFDSSVERGEPITFPVNGVIKGWIEALQLMVVGDKWRLTVPSELAYGAQAQGQIPANSVLIFEVELIEIIK
ncbi:MAG: FKBP-type peptidyl-prolyl cis-trans isomerase [Rhizobiales bacterium]|nr:FKBP-type peptidyl-prolyl cis-trans isomerase [Hyphomicrobiales bacterium]